MSDGTLDLVVAGAGGGLIAAIHAAERGLDVVVVESNDRFRRGNNTSMSTAMIPAVGTRWQREAGVEDDADRFVADVARKTGGAGDLALAAALAAVSDDLLSWLADTHDLSLSLMTEMNYPGHSAHRCHTVGGRHGSVLLDFLLARVKDLDVDILVPARLVDVERDAVGAVVAAVTERPDGTRDRLPTAAVLLATNGFGADRDLVAQHCADIAGAAYHGSSDSRGDALRIGRRHGAATSYLDAYQGHAALAARTATLAGWASIMHGGVMVDTAGERFGDETQGYSEFGPLLAQRPGGVGWLIFDRRVHDLCLRFTDYRQTVDGDAVVWADNLGGLARATGLPATTLTVELSDASDVARGETAVDRFGRRDFEAPLAPPYAAVRVVPALFHTQGGLSVDRHARVLAASTGEPIPGLYASGGAAAGISGHGAAGYLAGNGLLSALGLSYLAAEHLTSAPNPATPAPRTRGHI